MKAGSYILVIFEGKALATVRTNSFKFKKLKVRDLMILGY